MMTEESRGKRRKQANPRRNRGKKSADPKSLKERADDEDDETDLIRTVCEIYTVVLLRAALGYHFGSRRIDYIFI